MAEERFFQIFNHSRVTCYATTQLTNAIQSWLNGFPCDESALMNRVSEGFNEKRRTCDCAKGSEKYQLRSDLFGLHRQGLISTDEFGSDLAITLYAAGFRKTAVFQFKITSRNSRVVMERRQLDDPHTYTEIGKRAFAFCLDRTTNLE